MPMAVVLPAPFGPSKREKIAFRDLEVDAFERFDAVFVDFGELAEDEGLHKSRVA